MAILSMLRDRQGNLDAMTIVAFLVGFNIAFSITLMVIGEFVAMFLRPDHRFEVQALGFGIGAVLAGFGPALAAYAAYWAADAYNAKNIP